MRRIIFILLFIGLIPIACEKVDGYFKITDLTCDTYKDDSLSQTIGLNDTITSNSIYFKINLSYDYISYNPTTPSFDFSQSALAYDKRKPGYKGLKDKLKSIKIYTDNVFNGNQAGSDLKDFFKWHDIQWDGQKKSIDSLVLVLNTESIFIGDANKYYLKVILNQKPIDGLNQVFNFDFIYENGSHQLISSSMIHFKK